MGQKEWTFAAFHEFSASHSWRWNWFLNCPPAILCTARRLTCCYRPKNSLTFLCWDSLMWEGKMELHLPGETNKIPLANPRKSTIPWSLGKSHWIRLHQLSSLRGDVWLENPWAGNSAQIYCPWSWPAAKAGVWGKSSCGEMGWLTQQPHIYQ